jgi:pyruvate formate lyase activating enzyme
LAEAGAGIIVRMPVITGINTGEENIQETAAFMKNLGLEYIELLPYHNTGEYKYSRLKIQYRLHGLVPPDKETLDRITQVFLDRGISAGIEGIVHDRAR